MDFVYAMLVLGGAVALLLWGAHMVQSGVQRAFGPRLQAFLGRHLRRRLVAFLAGIGITLLLQSSTATGLMATGFAAGALVDLIPGLAVMAGANVGTALIVQVLSFDISGAAPILVLGGVVLFRREPTGTWHDLGRVLIGLGLMLISLHQMLAVVAPYADSSDLRLMLRVLTDIPVLALLLAAIAAWLVHSSVAIVLLVMTLAAHGVVPLQAAIVLVLGANLGTALNPLFEGSSATDPVARRVPLGNLLNRIVGVLAAIGLAGPIASGLGQLGLSPGPATAAFHVLFNLMMAVVMLPLLDPVAALLRRVLPEPAPGTDPREPLYLDTAAREVPEVGLGGAAREVLRLADTLEKMLTGARDALDSNDRKLSDAVRELDDVLDSLNQAVNAYLTSFDPEELSEEDRARRHQLLTFSMSMEQAGDVVDRALLAHNQKRIRRGTLLSSDEVSRLKTQMDRLIANLRTAATLLMTSDPRAARLLAREKVEFRRAEREATNRHLESLRDPRSSVAEGSAIALDLLRDMKIINSFIVAAGAYPVLDRAGELRASRVVVGES